MSYLGIRDQFLDAYGGENRKSIKLGVNNVFNNAEKYNIQDLNAILDTGRKPKKNDFGFSGGVYTGSPWDEAGFNTATSNYNSLYASLGNMFISEKGLFGDSDGKKDDDKDPGRDVGTVEGTGQLYDTGQETQEIPGIEPIAPVSVREQVGADYTPRNSGRGVAGIEGYAGSYGIGPNLGRVAFGRALMGGYTMNDIRNAMNSGSLPRNINGDPLQVGGRVRSVLANPSQISSIYGGIPGESRGADRFQREDYDVNRAVGFSNLAIKEYLDANQWRLNPKDMPGAGGLYDYVVGQLPKAIPGRAGVDAKSLLIGGSRIGTGGYASGVQSNRSDAYKSGRSTMGTSQYRR